jgi:hypothetical protein
MKKIFSSTLLVLTLISSRVSAQDGSTPEKFGNTLNIGLGAGYYGYIGYSVPAVTANYEFDVLRNFTLAPFIGVYSFRDYYYWGDQGRPYQNYYYRETVIPVGVKASYYFDELLHAGSKWDFYAAASLGFAFRTVTWDDGYYGDRSVYQTASPLYLALHIGTEYHLNQKLGLFIDLSTSMSTVGLAVHL